MAYQITYEAFDKPNPAKEGTTIRCGRIVGKRVLSEYDLVDRAIAHGQLNALRRNEAVAVFRSIMDEGAEAMKECYTVKMGKFRMQMTLKGQLGENDSIGPNNWIKTAITAGDDLKVDMGECTFVNAQTSAKVSIVSLTTEGSSTAGTWTKTKNLTVSGSNLVYDRTIGDRVIVSYIQDGETKTVEIGVASSQYNSMTLNFIAIDKLPVGEAEISFTLHGGNADAVPKTITKKVTIVAAS